MRRIKLGLLARIGIAIALGLCLGPFSPPWLTRIFATFNYLFFQYLGFMVPLIIIGLITPAISSLGRGAGKWLGITAGIAYVSTLFAGFLALGTGLLVFPHMLKQQPLAETANPDTSLLKPFFEMPIPPMFNVMTSLALAFVIGVALTSVPGKSLERGFLELRDIVNKVISATIVPILPIYIFGIMLNMAASGQAFQVIGTFLPLVVLVFALTVFLLIVQYGIAGTVARRNPFALLGTMMPAYATALGTSSSAATIPVTLRQTIRMGVSEPVASFVIPLCATVHLAGSTLKITSFALAIMFISGMEVKLSVMFGFVLLLGITMIAAPGVPGGAIVAASGLLPSVLGFTEPQVGLMIATYIAIDSFGTATNVTGDGAIAILVDRLGAGKLGNEMSELSAETTPDPV